MAVFLILISLIYTFYLYVVYKWSVQRERYLRVFANERKKRENDLLVKDPNEGSQKLDR